jgi:hypothetical protein
MRDRLRFEREMEILLSTESEYESFEQQRQEQCKRKWLKFRDSLPQPVNDALDKLDFDLAVSLAVSQGLQDVNDLTNMLFYQKYGTNHGYCDIKKGTRVPNGEPYDQAWGQLRNKFVLPKLPTPVIHLEKIKILSRPETKLRPKSDGTYEGWFIGPIHLSQYPSTPRQIELTGRLQMEDSGVRRNYVVKRDGKRWPLSRATIKASAKLTNADGPVHSTAYELPVKADGTFTTSTGVGFNGSPKRFTIRVLLKFSSSTALETSIELKLIEMDLARFIGIVDPKEKARPSSQTHLEFLASVRKIYQGGSKDPLEGAFNFVLYRYRDVDELFAPDSREGNWLRQNAVLYADGEALDIGHVLTGIEGSPRQDPNKDQEVPLPKRTETLVTWAGDLGSVFQYHLPDIVNALNHSQQPDLKTYLEKRANRSDLIGDIDGINIGSVYDPKRSLAENLNAYYGKKSLRRFHEFIANSLDDSNNPALPLVAGSKPPRLSAQAREWVASCTHRYIAYVRMKGVLDKIVDPSKGPLVDKIIDQDSPQMRIVVDYFVAFLEEGLARES